MNRTGIKPLQYLCRHYIDVQQVRIGLEHRIRYATEEYMIRMLGEALNMDKEKLEKLKFIKKLERTEKYNVTSKGKRAFDILREKGKITPDKNVEELLEMLKKYRNRIKNEEKVIVNEARKILENTALFDWCENVRGLATISAMEYLGFVKITVPTGGHVKAYMGLIPEASMKSGAKTKVNWEAKGKGYLFARNVIMQRDEYYYCYSEDTKVMTKRGLKSLLELTYNDEIMTLNPLTREIEYQKPIAIHIYDYVGEMIHFEGRFTNLLVTPNHRMVIDHNGSIKFIKAEEILKMYKEGEKKRERYYWLHKRAIKMLENGLSSYKIAKKLGVPVDTVYGWKYGKKPLGNRGRGNVFRNSEKGYLKQVRSAIWYGSDIPTIRIPEIHYRGHKGNVLSEVDTKLWMKFLGWYLSEGSCWRTKNSCYVFSFGNKEYENIKEFCDILSKLGFKYSRVKFSNVLGVVFNSKQLYYYFEHNIGARNKYIPQSIKDLSIKYLNILLETLIKGDGSTQNNNTNTQYHTISKRLAEDVAEIALKCGYGVSITKNKASGTYIVGIQKFRSGVILPKPHTESYRGKVWCVTVPNSIIMVERKGKFAWCGNSLYSAKKWYLANRSKYAVALKDPSKCPYHKECLERLKKRAEREGRKPKSPACKAHIDGMAKRWLAGMLVEHMWEVCRLEKGGNYVRGKAKGWDIPLHKMHIPPKPKDKKEMEEILKIAVPLLREGLVPEVNLGNPNERRAMLKYLEEFIGKQRGRENYGG